MPFVPPYNMTEDYKKHVVYVEPSHCYIRTQTIQVLSKIGGMDPVAVHQWILQLSASAFSWDRKLIRKTLVTELLRRGVAFDKCPMVIMTGEDRCLQISTGRQVLFSQMPKDLARLIWEVWTILGGKDAGDKSTEMDLFVAKVSAELKFAKSPEVVHAAEQYGIK
jgi:hypothetical protein